MAFRLIAFSGKARAGKDTSAEVLIEHHNFWQLSFAEGIKEVARQVGWNGEKDEAGRKLLQELGRILREYNPDYTIQFMQKQLDSIPQRLSKTMEPPFEGGLVMPQGVVITDCRYPNEADWIASQPNSTLIRIQRPNNPDALTGEAAQHETEIALDDYSFENIIVNDGTKEELHRKVEEYLK